MVIHRPVAADVTATALLLLHVELVAEIVGSQNTKYIQVLQVSVERQYKTVVCIHVIAFDHNHILYPALLNPQIFCFEA